MLLTLKQWFKPVNADIDWLHEYKLSGDPRHLEKLVDLYSQDLFHYLCTLSTRDNGQDIMQLTWLTVINKRQSYRQTGHPKAYLFAIARNAMLDELRKQKRLTDLTEIDDIESVDSLETQSHQTLYDAIKSLPFAQREAISLQLEGFSLAEIAQITDVANETVKTRLRYAKQHLQHVLTQLEGI